MNTEPNYKLAFQTQLAAVEAGHSTFDEAVERLATIDGPCPLVGEAADEFRATVAMFLRESLRDRGIIVRAPSHVEMAAHAWWKHLVAEVLDEPLEPAN